MRRHLASAEAVMYLALGWTLCLLRILSHSCTLPYLNFLPSSKNADPHSSKQIMRCIWMLVHSTIEDCSGIFSNRWLDQKFPAGVLIYERSDVVDHACDSYQRSTTSINTRGLEIIPINDRKLAEWNAPLESCASGIKLLLLLLETTLFDFIRAELLEIVGEIKLSPDPDWPFSWVVLIPCNGIA